MSPPVLVVDPGAMCSTAAVVTSGDSQLLKEPSSGSYCWPTAVARDGDYLRPGTIAERRRRPSPALYAGRLTGRLADERPVSLGERAYQPHELFAALLGAMRAEAERLTGARVTRILLLTPGDRDPATPLGQAMTAAAVGAGFADIELFLLPAAVLLAAGDSTLPDSGPTISHPPAWGNPAPRTAPRYVLICDAGASALRLTLLRVQEGQPSAVRSQTAVTSWGGYELDALMTEAIERKHGKWLRPLLNADAEAVARTRLDLWDLGHRMRHELSDAENAADSLTALTPVVQVSRQDLEKWMRPALRQVAAACRDLFTQAGPRPGGTASEPVSRETVTAVILAGGGARVPALCEALSGALQRPVRAVPAPELTALRGGIEWARAAAARRVPAIPAPAGLRELTWEIPGGAAHLTRWNAEPGTAFGAHEPLATVRTEDDALWDLSSDRPGILEQRCQPIGAIVASGDVLAISRLTAIGPPDRLGTPGRIGALHGGRFAAFSADGRQAATLDTGGVLRIWDVETGAELTSAPVSGRNEPGWLDAATRPDGNWVTAFHDGNAVVVYDVTASRRVSRLVKSSEPVTVQFSSDGMRLRTGERKRATIWDDHWHDVLIVKEKLLGSDAVAMSKDGRLLAVASRAGIEVWQQPIPKRALVRPLPKFKGRVWQIAFTPGADRLLLAIDMSLELVELPSGQPVWAVDVPGPVTSAAFSPDEHLLATVNQTGPRPVTVLRDPASGKIVDQLSSAADGADGWVRFSPDGRLAASPDGDETVLWALVH